VPQSTQSGLTDAQIEQANARRLLGGLRNLMPLVDQYLPSRAAAVRQKITEVGLDGGRRGFPSQAASGAQPTSESLVALAASAPPAMQSGIYNRAALRALDEGNLDRARQIANDHLDSNIRESMLKRIESRQLADKTEATKVEDVRLTLSQLPSDSERVTLLLRLSETAQKNNPELAISLLEQAREYTNKRATGYQQFEQQLRVSAAFAALESSQGFEVLEPGIMQLNELLAAASVLSGFETNVFREGEMPIQGGGNLSDMVRRFGQQIGSLARIDFERAQSLAGRFQFAESRVVARLAMARILLGSDSTVNQGARGFRTFNQNPNRQE
jgi:hypothetical protein